MITTVVSREDHANNLRLKARHLFYNLHVRFFFEMKKASKRNAQPTYVVIFSRRQAARGRKFLQKLCFLRSKNNVLRYQ